MGQVKIKRIYENAEAGDGFRILVDRLWPRGIKKENAVIDVWLKEIAPSNTLRKWFDHDPARWKDFQKAYNKELKGSAAVKELVRYIRKNKTVTLLYGAKDEEYNQALALKRFIEVLVCLGKK